MRKYLLAVLLFPLMRCSTSPDVQAVRQNASYRRSLSDLNAKIREESAARDALVKEWARVCTGKGAALGIDDFKEVSCIPDPKAQQAAGTGQSAEQKAMPMRGTVKVDPPVKPAAQ